MNLQQLRYLVATADAGTMTAAATAQHVSQPALTRALRALEAELALPLLARVGRGVELTEAGAQVTDLARNVLRDIDAIVALQRPALRICATETQASYLFSGMLARLATKAPDVRVTLDTVDSFVEVVETLSAGRADLGLCDRPPRHDLRWTSLGVQELGLIFPSSWSLPDPIPVQQLDRMPMIVPPTGARDRVQLDRFFEQAAIQLDVKVTIDRRDLTAPLVSQGIGASLAWTETAGAAAHQGVSVVHLDPPLRREVGVVTRGTRLPPGARAVLDALRAEAKGILDPVPA